MFHFGISGLKDGRLVLCKKPVSAALAGLICAFSQMSGCGGSKISSSVPVARAIAPPASGTVARGSAFNRMPPDTSAKALVPEQQSGPAYSWTNVKIVGGGYVTGLYFHPSQQHLMYARTDIGEAYRWGPGDTQWVPLLDFIAKANWWQSGVEAIGLDPSNPDKLYLAVGEYTNSWDGNGAMLISNDQGNTFTTVPLPFKNGSNDAGRNTGERIAVDPNLSSTVYFGTRVAGLQISTDSGASWGRETGLPVTKTSNGNGVVAVLPIAPSGSSGSASPVVYAITGGTGTGADPQAIYVSTNGGTTASTWTAVAGQPSFGSSATPLAPLQAKLGPDGAIYILYGDQPGPNTMHTSQLWKFLPDSHWTSGTWTEIGLPNRDLSINSTNGYGGIAVDPRHAGQLLLSTLDQYWPTGDIVYRSTDDGAMWRDVSSAKNSADSASPGLATHDSSLSPYIAFGRAGGVSTGNWSTALAIDPFNSAHAIYGTGQTIWVTRDLTNADPSAESNGIVHWTVGANGIEETAVLGLWAPPKGNTVLLSALGDIYGFAHQDLTASPPQQMFNHPAAAPTSMDFEQDTPTTVVRVTDGASGAAPIGVISTDAGLTWKAFPTMPPGTNGGGVIAIARDGASLVWATEDTTSVWYSRNLGQTWSPSTGIDAQAQVASDRVNANLFYGYSNGLLTMSTDGGATFSTVQSGLPRDGILSALPDAQADLWLAGQGSGLYSNSGKSTSPELSAIAGIHDAYHLGFGKSAAGTTKPALYLDGQIAGVWGLYRSIDGGSTWTRINDSAHQWGGFTAVCGDMRTFGTVYLGTESGRGIIWGTSAN